MESSQQVMKQRVQRNLANQAETEHLQGDIEKTCIEAQFDEYVTSYNEGMLEMKISKLDADPGLGLL